MIVAVILLVYMFLSPNVLALLNALNVELFVLVRLATPCCTSSADGFAFLSRIPPNSCSQSSLPGERALVGAGRLGIVKGMF